MQHLFSIYEEWCFHKEYLAEAWLWNVIELKYWINIVIFYTWILIENLGRDLFHKQEIFFKNVAWFSSSVVSALAG